MRIYHIYRQKAKIVAIHCEYADYRWLPYEYIGYVEGTKELYKVMQNHRFRGFRSEPPTYNSMSYSTHLFRRKYPCGIFDYEQPIIERFIILDDKGYIRDYHELTDKYKKCRVSLHKTSYQVKNYCSYVGDRRKSITPEEIKEVKNEYGISMCAIKPKRNLDSWNMRDCNKVSQGWKKQSKRRKQWKEKGGKQQ